MGFLRYMRESIGKRLTVKHLTTVCLQSDKGQVKQLSLYSHTVFFAAFGGLCGLLYTLAHIFSARRAEIKAFSPPLPASLTLP